MNKSPVVLRSVPLPDFNPQPIAPPDLSANLYRRRLLQVQDGMKARNLDVLVIYADREHSANVAYLTGFDPRFEEALLLLSMDGKRTLLVGNECLGFLPDVKALRLKVELFQDFSLMGQPRDASRSLAEILREFGIGKKQRVGCVGWKSYDGILLGSGKRALDVPAYLADMLRELTGHVAHVENAADIFTDVQDGLRITNEPEQIAQFEYAASVSSNGVLQLLRHLKPGVAEHDLERHLDSRGLPLSCHRMISFGAKAQRGLASPGPGQAQLGDTFTTALGVQGSLTSRAGAIARSPRDLPEALREFYPRFAANYFQVVKTWYETVAVGVSAGDVFNAVEHVRDSSLFRFAVNPGHYLHLDEWVHSPFALGSGVKLRSGMALQMDIIPISVGPFCYINAEDGIVLASAPLRRRLEHMDPAMWTRMQARRDFMIGQLGIQLDESVLPLSNIPGWLPPYALNLKQVLAHVS